MPSSQTHAVVGAARLFALIAIGAPILWLHQEEGLLALGTLTLVWLYQSVTSVRRDLELSLSPLTEAAAIGVICALGMAQAPSILAALVVPPLYATAMTGTRTMVRTVLVELIAVVALALMWWEEITSEQAIAIFTWAMAGLGLSLIAAVTFSSDRVADPIAPYRDAREHLRQLLDLSDNLSSGLDVGAIGGELLSKVGDRIPNRGLVLYLHRGDTISPLASTVELDAADKATCRELAADILRPTTGPSTGVQHDHGFALLASDQAIVAGLRPVDSESHTPPLGQVVRDLGDSAGVDTAVTDYLVNLKAPANGQVFQPNAQAGGYMVDGDPDKIIPLVRQGVELGADRRVQRGGHDRHLRIIGQAREFGHQAQTGAGRGRHSS